MLNDHDFKEGPHTNVWIYDNKILRRIILSIQERLFAWLSLYSTLVGSVSTGLIKMIMQFLFLFVMYDITVSQLISFSVLQHIDVATMQYYNLTYPKHWRPYPCLQSMANEEFTTRKWPQSLHTLLVKCLSIIALRVCWSNSPPFSLHGDWFKHI